ncbi:MAG: Rieske (2Fe-2S) protein [Alphaproteobacteria bacterium]
MSDAPARGAVLCRLEDIPAPGSKGFVVGDAPPRRKLFVVRDDGGVYAYENSCPHSRGQLEWVEHQFLSLDRKHIQCCFHGAMFQIHDGLCVYGPCVGQSLTPVRIAVADGAVVLADEG